MRFLQIEFMDGSKETFSFPVQATTPAAQRMQLEDFLQGQFAVIACASEVLVFPLANIKAIRLTLPEAEVQTLHLPPSAIRGAEPR